MRAIEDNIPDEASVSCCEGTSVLNNEESIFLNSASIPRSISPMVVSTLDDPDDSDDTASCVESSALNPVTWLARNDDPCEAVFCVPPDCAFSCAELLAPDAENGEFAAAFVCVLALF